MKPAVTPELLAAVCHDLRGPLGAIGTWVHVLASGQADDETRAQALAAMGRDVRAQGALLEQLGELAALVADEVVPKPAAVELAPLLATLAAAEAGVRLDAAAAPRVQADPDLLRRLLAVLVASAIKRPAAAAVTVSVRQEPEGVVVEVAADGPPRLLSTVLARGLAELQGGSLTEAAAGARTVLTLRLPAA